MTRKNKKTTFYLLSFVIIVLVINLIFIINTNLKNSNKELLAQSEIFTEFRVGKNPGMAVESEYLFFGRVTRSGNSEKQITIHPYDEPVLVKIHYSDNISDHLAVDKNNFKLYPKNKSINLTFTLRNLHNLSYGNYTGKVYIDYWNI